MTNKSIKTRLIDQQKLAFLLISTRKMVINCPTFYYTTWRELGKSQETRRESGKIVFTPPNRRRFGASLLSRLACGYYETCKPAQFTTFQHGIHTHATRWNIVNVMMISDMQSEPICHLLWVIFCMIYTNNKGFIDL